MTRVRRVLMTGDTVGGVFSYCVDLSRALGELGIEVVLVTMGKRASSAQRAEAARVRNLVLHDYDLALEWMHDPWHDVEHGGRVLLALEAAVAPDVVHVNGYAHAALPFAAPVVCVAHSSVDTWFRAVKGEAMPSRYARYAREAARGLAMADAVVAPTHTMLRQLETSYGRIARARVIENGVLLARYAAREKQEIILASGRTWDEAKNLDAVARAAAEVPWPVEVAGAHPGERVPFPLQSLGALGRDELASRMGEASIFLHPARYEPFGLGVVEAALSGCALVLGDIESLHEVWEDAAIFVHPDDEDGLAEALLRLIDDSDVRAAAAERANARALRFSSSTMARSYLDLYGALPPRAQRASKTMAAPP
jgi:glycogen synthase